MKYKQDWVKGREDMLQTSDLEQTNGQKDGQIDHYRVPEEQGPNYSS